MIQHRQSVLIGGVQATLQLAVQPEAVWLSVRDLESQCPDLQTATDIVVAAFRQASCETRVQTLLLQAHEEFHQLLVALTLESLLKLKLADAELLHSMGDGDATGVSIHG